MKHDQKIEEEVVPAVARFWNGLSRRWPAYQVAGMNISLTVASALFLTIFRVVAERVLESIFGWPINDLQTKIAAASIPAIFHSCLLVPSLALCFAWRWQRPQQQQQQQQQLMTSYAPTESLDQAPVWWQQTADALLQFCTGYMIYDGLFNIVTLKSGVGLDVADYLFLGHHIATALYMTSTRVTGAGHISAMMCMLLGECTNPAHNAHYVASMAQKLDCCNGPLSQLCYRVIEFSFALSYCLVRAIVAPPILLHMTWCLWFRRNARNPVWLTAIWTVLIWGVMLGSIPWIVECWHMLEKYLPAILLPTRQQPHSGSSTSEL